MNTLPLLGEEEQEDTTELYRLQARSLQSVDRAVADIIQTLEETGRLSNAAIIYTTDNGFSMGEHRWIPKRCVYESCSRVPLLIRAPGIHPRTEDSLVSIIDLTATILDFAGLSAPTGMDSVSLAGLLNNPGTLYRKSILLELFDQPYEKKMNF